jgi:hypothetical protein
MSDDKVLQELRDSLAIPPGPEICRRAMSSVLGDKADDAAWIKGHFSYLVSQVQKEAYEIYLTEEKPAAMAALREVLLSRLSPSPSANDLLTVMEDNFSALDKFFLGLAQGRKPRAGKAFEHVIRHLFAALGYPYASQPVINGQPDFLLPSKEYFERNAMDCIIFTVKRTLRERWRQITTEGTQGFRFFLATIDSDVAKRDLPEMSKSRIYLVVPVAIKSTTYSEAPNVISFEVFFEQHLDPAMVRWRKNGVIP